MDRAPLTVLFIPYARLHRLLYQATGGRVGRRLAGSPTLLLTTVGRRSGQPRSQPLSYVKDHDRWVVVASNAGSDRPPAWLLNLQENPDVVVHEGTMKHLASARVATDEERTQLWERMNRRYRGLAPWIHRGTIGRYDAHQRRTRRELAVVVLEPHS